MSETPIHDALDALRAEGVYASAIMKSLPDVARLRIADALARELEITTELPKPDRRALTADRLFEALRHGDERHQIWLREAIECVFEGREVPPPAPPGHPNRSAVNLDDLAEAARGHADFPSHISPNDRLNFFALELCGEVGEHANFMKKIWRGDYASDRAALRDALDRAARELIDAQVIVLMQASLLDVDVLAEALRCMLAFERTDKWRRMLEAVPLPVTRGT